MKSSSERKYPNACDQLEDESTRRYLEFLMGKFTRYAKTNGGSKSKTFEKRTKRVNWVSPKNRDYRSLHAKERPEKTPTNTLLKRKGNPIIGT